jgi:ABC-type transporter Mla MlaB component
MSAGKLEINLDACRLSSEILRRLRTIVRDTLRTLFGDDWITAGVPSELWQNLSRRQAREASINWNLSDDVDILDYAGFADLYDLIVTHEPLLERFLNLAPDASVLRIRFLELDTIISRIAYARPVTETELGFLASFDERLKRAGDGAGAAPRGARAPTRARPPAPAQAAPVQPPMPEAPPAPIAKVAPPQPAEAVEPAVPAAPPPKPARKAQAEAAKAEAPEAAPAVAAPAKGGRQVGARELDAALKKADDKQILGALYHEITRLADGLWNGDVGALTAGTWNTVRESAWYKERFSKLGLRPLSDFYGLFESVRDKAHNGASRNEQQDFLKDHNFVQVLLALKELFRLRTR